MQKIDSNITFSDYKAAFENFKMAYVSAENPEFNPDGMLKLDKEHLFTRSMKAGYLIDPNAYSPILRSLIDDITINPNATFYKTWEDVISKTRFELWIDQIHHYLTTYGGLSEQDTNGYVPNNKPAEIDYSVYTVIMAADAKTIAERCYGLLKSGMALTAETLDMCINFICVASLQGFEFDINEIKNKEAKCRLSVCLGISLADPVEILRTIVYQTTKNTLIIKNRKSWNQIQMNNDFYLELSNNDIKKLSEIFYRFKPLFLALRQTNNHNKKIVNQIRRLAKTNHIPMVKTFWDTILDKKWIDNAEHANKFINRADNPFKLLRALQVLDDVLNYVRTDEAGNYVMDEYTKTFIIRNGLQYVRDYETVYLHPLELTWYKMLRNTIYQKITCTLREYAEKTGKRTILVEDNLNIKCPVSERQFAGNMPYGSSYKLQKNNYIGVYWRGEWGTQDFDLSYLDYNYRRYGWNSSFVADENALVFSGDMTRANPEAVEMFFCKNIIHNGMVMLNRFNGEVGSKARIFVGSDNLDNGLGQRFMIKPDSIKMNMSYDVISSKKEQIVGLVLDGRIYVVDIPTQNRMVANVNELAKRIMNGTKRKIQSYIDFKTLAEDSGYKVVTSVEELGVDENGNLKKPDYDFELLTKDALVNFLTEPFKK